MAKNISFTPEQVELAAKLTPLQRKCVIEYLKPNVTQRQAYLSAGGKAKTESAQDVSANQIFKNLKVAAFYKSMMETKTIDSIMTRNEALERLSKSARATIHDVCTFKLVEVETTDKNGDPVTEFNTIWEMKCTDEIDPVIAAAIKSVTFTKTGPKIEMYDSNGSIKLLSDIEGWNAPKKTELTGAGGEALNVKTEVKAPEIASALAGLMAKL